MRCSNCGWENPEGIMICQKCNKSLTASAMTSCGSVAPVFLDREKAVHQRRTVMDASLSTLSNDSVWTCSSCGYPATCYSSFCPNCGSPKAYGSDYCTLIPTDKKGKKILLKEGQSISIDGCLYIVQLRKPINGV